MKKRIAILHSHPAPYFLACLRTLHDIHGAEILAVFWESERDIDFLTDTSRFIANMYRRQDLSTEQLVDILSNFCPDAIYLAGWMDRGYLRAGYVFKKRGVPVIAGLDNQWRGTFRQWQAVFFWKLFLHQCIDIIWVAGERQAQYARLLGFGGRRIWYGFYCCDWEQFHKAYIARETQSGRGFLFVGRYVSEKGLDLLLKAYQGYRESVIEPLELRCAGAGPLKSLLQKKPGVIDLNFIRPGRLPETLLSSSIFVLPSTFEPWGVVIQEAAASGMIVICSDACGAAVHLVQDHYNGYLFPAGNVDELKNRLIMAARLSFDESRAMAEAGHELSKQFKSERWAETFINGIGAFSQST